MNQTITADLNEILFAHREKNYGAYMLRKRYPKVLFLAILIMVAFALSLPLSNVIAYELGWIGLEGKKPIPFWVNIPFSFKLLK